MDKNRMMAIIKTKTIKYYPAKVKDGFELVRTDQTQHRLGFAVFRTQKKALGMGKIWYGKFLGYDTLSFPNKNKTRFKRLKGVNADIRKAIFHDLECLGLKKSSDNDYHYKLLLGNLTDLLGDPKEE